MSAIVVKIRKWFKDVLDPEDKTVILREDGKLYDIKRGMLL